MTDDWLKHWLLNIPREAAVEDMADQSHDTFWKQAREYLEGRRAPIDFDSALVNYQAACRMRKMLPHKPDRHEESIEDNMCASAYYLLIAAQMLRSGQTHDQASHFIDLLIDG